MKSIRKKVTLLIICAIIVSLGITAFIGAVSIKNQGKRNAGQMLYLMCKTGRMDLESYFNSVEHSVKTVSTLVQGSLDGVSEDQLGRHVELANVIFG